MLGITDLSTYLVGLVLIILLPGPNSLYVLSVAARRGVRDGYTAALGVFTGDAVLMILAAGGAASLLKTNDVAFAVVKFLGAGYLGWLALSLLRAALATWRARHTAVADVVDAIESDDVVAQAAAAARGAGRSAHVDRERPYRRALVISLLNPKAILFFIAFFVQFVDPAYAHPALTFLVLGTMLQIASALYLSALIFGGTRLAAVFRRRRGLTAAATAGVGAVFLGFAVKLSLSHA
ncbi:leucine efflux protein LeuE [Nocardioides sp. R-C-SC26]|uniref:leucine efflux protein LeuE n=1 Tax=Nocardioides sp. R-C-SC26 TaxID=2870414 RepID=UPI001E540BC0|nr:leucine efflux protein LeuE [Nocardioides sp. R-C-SC26]